PLPPKERTVGQLVAESIRLYGHRFWPALVLGLPIAVVTQVSAGQSLTTQMIVLWAATPFLTAAYVRSGQERRRSPQDDHLRGERLSRGDLRHHRDRQPEDERRPEAVPVEADRLGDELADGALLRRQR